MCYQCVRSLLGVCYKCVSNAYILLNCRYLANEIEQGLGREIRCPDNGCYRIVPHVRIVYMSHTQ